MRSLVQLPSETSMQEATHIDLDPTANCQGRAQHGLPVNGKARRSANSEIRECLISLSRYPSTGAAVSLDGDWRFDMGASGCSSEGRDEALPLCIRRSAKQHRRSTLLPPSSGGACLGVRTIASCNRKSTYPERHVATSGTLSSCQDPAHPSLHNANKPVPSTLFHHRHSVRSCTTSSSYSSCYPPSP